MGIGIVVGFRKTLSKLQSLLKIASIRRLRLSDLQKNLAFESKEICVRDAGEPDWSSVIFVSHVYHADGIADIATFLRNCPAIGQVIFTVPNNGIKVAIETALGSEHSKVEFKLVQNRGRNFGALLAECRNEIQKFEYLLHTHTKESAHAKKSLKEAWTSRLSGFFLDEKIISRALQLLSADNELAISYPKVADLFRGLNFGWGQNLAPLTDSERLSVLVSGASPEDIFSFPAGGMFLAKTNCFTDLWRMDWQYSDFPDELGQLDGTVQHGVERLFGWTPIAHVKSHLIYEQSSNKFLKSSGLKVNGKH